MKDAVGHYFLRVMLIGKEHRRRPCHDSQEARAICNLYRVTLISRVVEL